MEVDHAFVKTKYANFYIKKQVELIHQCRCVLSLPFITSALQYWNFRGQQLPSNDIDGSVSF